ncbi:MAG: hypothetical protein M1823_002518 [Watsoniomyces obsoletus]|nr:MAG: hypothetical protein M1823_002518 [Watsoniomyces obsoletus]
MASSNVDTNNDNTQPSSSAIDVRQLNYTFPDGTVGLKEINLGVPAGSRVLLIGANGAGKTCLLRLLSGKRLAPAGSITINGLDPFTENLTGITYLGLEWVLNPIVRSDIAVPALLSSVGGDAYPARRDELVRILDVDLNWRLHAVSDGERRRVQLVMGLLRPWNVLLLDEVTVDLDLLSRRRFLEWLKRETEERVEDVVGSQNQGRVKQKRRPTVVYATHVMDGLNDWPTHLVHMFMGRAKRVEEWSGGGKKEEEVDGEMKRKGHEEERLGDLALKWLTQDLEERGPRNQNQNQEGMSSQGRTYASMDGKGGYGNESRR